MAAHFPYDVFLSHNAQDKPRVRRLAERLKQAGLRVWFDESEKPKAEGKRLNAKIELQHSALSLQPLLQRGLEQSRVLLLCLSPNALASGWVALERSTAIHRDPSNEGRRFIPLLLAKCDLPDTLRRKKYFAKPSIVHSIRPRRRKLVVRRMKPFVSVLQTDYRNQ